MCYDPRTWLGTPHIMSTNHVIPKRPLDGPPSEYSTCSMSSASSCSILDGTNNKRPNTFYIKSMMFFFLGTSCKISRYIAINLIIFIIKTLLLSWYLFLFNIFLNFTRLPFRNIFYIIKNRGNISGNIYFSPRLFNKNNNFSKFLRKPNNFYKKRD